MDYRSNNKSDTSGLSLARTEEELKTPPKPIKINVEDDIVVTQKVTGNLIDEQGEKKLSITGCFAMLAAILWCATCLWNVKIGNEDISLLYKNTTISVIVAIVCCVVFTMDAIFVKKYYKQNIFLFIFAWIFNFMYIAIRQNFLKAKQNIVSIVFSLVMLSCTIGCGYTLYQYNQRFALVQTLDNKTDQDIYRSFLKQIAVNDKTYNDVFYEAFPVSAVAIRTTPGGQNMIFLQGYSNYNVIERGYVDTLECITDKDSAFEKHDKKDVKTQVEFIQPHAGQEYRLSSVSINGRVVRPSLVSTYWKNITSTPAE